MKLRHEVYGKPFTDFAEYGHQLSHELWNINVEIRFVTASMDKIKTKAVL